MTTKATNAFFPGQPYYTGPTTGVFALIHHSVLAEYSWNIKERVSVINDEKPVHEIATRLRCLVYLDPAGQPWEQAYQTWARAEQPWARVYQTGQQAYHAWLLPYKSWQQVLTEAQPILEAQIRALVPDLPWDGEKLVFEETIT